MGIRVFLVYESALIRSGIQNLLSEEDWIETVGQARDFGEALEKLKTVECEVIVADVNLPELSLAKFAERLACEEQAPRILIVPSHRRDHHVEELLRAGVRGFLDASASASDLTHAIEVVAEGRYYISDSVAQSVMRGVANNYQQEESLVDKLSNRERQTLILVAEGLTSKEIASQLGLSTRTIETYRQAMMTKLDLHKTADLVRFAIREGLTAS